MIEIRFLGSGSLGGIRPKNKLSGEYRRFSSLLIDERIVIDPAEDIFEFAETYQLSEILGTIEHVLITHTHLDHLSISTLERLATSKPIAVYGSATVGEYIGRVPGLTFYEIRPFERHKIGGYDVIPLPSNHATDNVSECVLNYLIVRERNIFYGLDGAFIHPLALEVLKKIPLDLCVLDCALGADGYSADSTMHNNVDMIKIIREILMSVGSIHDGTKLIASHIPTVKRRSVADEMREAIGDLPISIAYDGYYICL